MNVHPTQSPVKLRRYRFPDDNLINLRPWLMRGLLLKKQVTAIIAAGGAGKSIFGLVVALHLCAGKDLGPFKCVGGPKRVAVLSVEEDDEELDRRLVAIRRQYGFTQEDAGRLFIINIRDMPILAQAAKNGTVNQTKAMQELERLLAIEKIEVFIFDPFVELWSGNENDNSQVKAVLSIFRACARRLGAACLMSHHVRKGFVSPGDIDASRGGSSSGGLVRVAFTLTNITAEMADTLGLEADDPLRDQLVRLDRAKGNYSANDRRVDWFQWRNIGLDNDPEGLNPDHVGVLVPWKAPGLFAGVTIAQIHTVLDAIAAAAARVAYSPARQSKRWAGHVLTEHFEWTEEKAAECMKVWFKSGLLVECNSKDERGRPAKGVNVDENKRPHGDSMSL